MTSTPRVVPPNIESNSMRLLIGALILSLAGCCCQPGGNLGGGGRGDGEGIAGQRPERGPVFSTVNGPVEFQFPPGWFMNQDEHPFDLQCLSKFEEMTTGVFLFHKQDLAEDFTADRLLELQIDDLRSKRDNFEVLEPTQTNATGDKKLTYAVFSGEKGAIRGHYRFTLIEFIANPELVLIALQTAIPSQWDKHKPILEAITQSARVQPGG